MGAQAGACLIVLDLRKVQFVQEEAHQPLQFVLAILDLLEWVAQLYVEMVLLLVTKFVMMGDLEVAYLIVQDQLKITHVVLAVHQQLLYAAAQLVFLFSQEIAFRHVEMD